MNILTTFHFAYLHTFLSFEILLYFDENKFFLSNSQQNSRLKRNPKYFCDLTIIKHSEKKKVPQYKSQ
jgi:hypothetical protein